MTNPHLQDEIARPGGAANIEAAATPATPAFVVVLFNKGDVATEVELQMAGDGAGGDLYPAAITGP